MVNTPSRVYLAAALVFASVLALPQFAAGQQVYGSIYGTVTDQTGAGVPGAKVTILDADKGTKFEVMSNEAGNYTRGQLIPGNYTVEVEGKGFRKTIAK